MCAKLSLAFCFALFFLVADTSQAQDVEIAVQLITQARSQLTVLGQSLALRETDLDERELILKSAGESLQEEWLLLEQDKIDSIKKEKYLSERERALPETQAQLQKLTDSYKKLSQSYKAASQARDRWMLATFIVGTLALAGWGAFGVSLLL